MFFQDKIKLNWDITFFELYKNIVIFHFWPEKFICDKKSFDCQSFIGLFHMCNAK